MSTYRRSGAQVECKWTAQQTFPDPMQVHFQLRQRLLKLEVNRKMK